MELDITRFFTDADPFDYSHSIAEGGDNAGRNTWNAAVKAAPDWNHLDTPEKRESFRSYVKGFGAWEKGEIAAWNNDELGALFIQMVSGDIREADLDQIDDDEQWEEYERKRKPAGFPVAFIVPAARFTITSATRPPASPAGVAFRRGPVSPLER